MPQVPALPTSLPRCIGAAYRGGRALELRVTANMGFCGYTAPGCTQGGLTVRVRASLLELLGACNQRSAGIDGLVADHKGAGRRTCKDLMCTIKRRCIGGRRDSQNRPRRLLWPSAACGLRMELRSGHLDARASSMTFLAKSSPATSCSRRICPNVHRAPLLRKTVVSVVSSCYVCFDVIENHFHVTTRYP